MLPTARTDPGGFVHEASQPTITGGGSTLGARTLRTKYGGAMSVKEYLVSASGQVSLPAAVRHRWHLDQGGPVEMIDLGFGVLTVPRGQARHLLNDLLPSAVHAQFVSSLDDPDLATT